jgi:hypothetical protein
MQKNDVGEKTLISVRKCIRDEIKICAAKQKIPMYQYIENAIWTYQREDP